MSKAVEVVVCVSRVTERAIWGTVDGKSIYVPLEYVGRRSPAIAPGARATVAIPAWLAAIHEVDAPPEPRRSQRMGLGATASDPRTQSTRSGQVSRRI